LRIYFITIYELSIGWLKARFNSRKSSRLPILNIVDRKIKLNPVRNKSTEKLLCILLFSNGVNCKMELSVKKVFAI